MSNDQDLRTLYYEWPVPVPGNRLSYDGPRIRTTLESIDLSIYTLNGALNAKANKESPAFTGTPTAPTAPSTANNTTLANTAHVKAAIALFGHGRTTNQPNWPNASLDDCTGVGTGVYRTIATTLDIPPGYNTQGVVSYYLRQNENGVVHAVQEFTDVAGRKAYRVAASVGTTTEPNWDGWITVFHSGNQLALGVTPATARTALELVKGTSPGNVLEAGAELVGRHTVECFAFSVPEVAPGATIYTNIPATEGVIPHLIIRGALNGYTEPFEARLSWYFYQGAVYLPSVLITATGGVSGVRFYLRPENGKIVIRIDFGSSFYLNRLAFDALCIPGGYNPDPTALRGWSAVALNFASTDEVEAQVARTYHTRNQLALGVTQASARSAIGVNWSPQSVDFTAVVGRKYLVMATISVYLDASAVAGDTIVFNKIATANPIIRTTNGKLIYVRDQSDIAVVYNYPTTLTVVYNGTNWEMTAG